MGLFSSLFGSGGSDKADKMRQQAYDAFSSIKTPELAALQVQLNNYVNAGKLSPEQAEATLLKSNAFNNIVTDPQYVGAQKQALQQLQAIGTQGGLTAADKARLQDITNQQNQEAQSRNASIIQNAQQQGRGGSDITTVNQLLNEQGAANRASQAGTDVAAQAEARALAALQGAGQLGGQIEGQQYGEQANKAQAQNAIDLFNANTSNAVNLENVRTANAAQAANLANAQSIANANTGTQNQNKLYNAAQNQTIYEDAMNKTKGEAGVLNDWANTAQSQAEKERNASAGLIAGGLQAGAGALGSAFGGPVAGNAVSSAVGTSFNPAAESTNVNYRRNPDGSYNFAEGGEVPVDHPEHPDHLAMGGHVHCYAHGGEAVHHPDCYMSKGGKTPHFLDGLKKGALHKDLGVPSDKKIPSGKLEKATNSENETLRKRAQFAENAKHWHHGKDGGEVPGKAKVSGDSLKNDTVNAKLSPGELVVPRSAMSDDEEFTHFMNKFRPAKKQAALDSHVPLATHALANLHSRVAKLEEGK